MAVEDPVREELAAHLGVDAELQRPEGWPLGSGLRGRHGGPGGEEVTPAFGRLLVVERDRLGMQHATLAQDVEVDPDILVVGYVADPGEDRQGDGLSGWAVPEPDEAQTGSGPRRHRLLEDVHHLGAHRRAGADLDGTRRRSRLHQSDRAGLRIA